MFNSVKTFHRHIEKKKKFKKNKVCSCWKWKKLQELTCYSLKTEVIVAHFKSLITGPRKIACQVGILLTHISTLQNAPNTTRGDPRVQSPEKCWYGLKHETKFKYLGNRNLVLEYFFLGSEFTIRIMCIKYAHLNSFN